MSSHDEGHMFHSACGFLRQRGTRIILNLKAKRHMCYSTCGSQDKRGTCNILNLKTKRHMYHSTCGFSRQKGHIYHSNFKDKRARVSFYLLVLIDKRGTCIILNLKTKRHMYHSTYSF